jgi:hypothetical protein
MLTVTDGGSHKPPRGKAWERHNGALLSRAWGDLGRR